MSRKPIFFCLLMAWAGTAAAQHEHVKVPLGNGIDHTAANEAKNPQSEGLTNANQHQTRNQARFIEKHVDGRAAERVERAEKVERAERPERPERVERPERPEVASREIPRGQLDRIDRPGLGKGR